MAHTELGIDQQSLLKLYRSLICSQLDYGSFVYRSARSYIKELNLMQNEGLRLILGAFKTSPVESLHAEEAPIQLESKKTCPTILHKT